MKRRRRPRTNDRLVCRRSTPRRGRRRNGKRPNWHSKPPNAVSRSSSRRGGRPQAAVYDRYAARARSSGMTIAPHGRAAPRLTGETRSRSPSVRRQSPDLRGFEWYYYQHLLEQSAAVFSGHGVSVVGGAFAANGQLVTLDQNGQVRHWDLDWQVEDEASRRDLPGGPALGSASCRPTDGWPRSPKATRFTSLRQPRATRCSRSIPPIRPYRRLIISRDGDRLVIVDDKIRWCKHRERRGDRIRRSEIRSRRKSRLVCRRSDAGRRRSRCHRRSGFRSSAWTRTRRR